jgi:putative oxidoreductase
MPAAAGRARRADPGGFGLAAAERKAAIDTGLLLVRVVIGLTLSGRGVQKLFGWFGGPGPSGAGAGFGVMGYRPGKAFERAV